MKRIKAKLKETFVGKLYIDAKKGKTKVKNKINKFYTLRILYPREYNKYKKYPVDENKVVFIEIRLPKLTNSFKLIYDDIVQNYEYDVHCHFLRNTFVSKKEYQQRCKEMLRDIATAKYVFLNEGSNVVSCVKMRPETIVTQTWHGCGAFKKFGFSTAELIFGDTKDQMIKYPFYKNYTYVTVSSPEVAWAYQEAMMLEDRKEVVVPTGVSRTDIFYNQGFIAGAYQKLLDLFPESKGKKVILYAPTFRGRVAKATTPPMLNVEMFQEALSDDYVLIVKNHPLVKKPPVIPEKCRKFAVDFTHAMSIEELLVVSDICISDYSSLVFEYSLLERPLIFFAYDLDEYFDWRGFYYDYFELTPGPVFTKNLEMIDYIQNIEDRFDKQRIIDFRQKFMSSCDGHCTERIMQMVFKESLETHRRAVPLQGEFNTVPNSDLLHSEREANVVNLRELSKEAKSLYEKQLHIPVEENKVVCITSKHMPKQRYKELEKELKKQKQMKCVTVSVDNALSEVIAQLVTARYIVIAGSCDLTNVLPIRKETTVVQLSAFTFPSCKFGYSTKEVISGYNKELLEIAPIHNNYGLVPVASEDLVDIYAEAYHIEDTSRIKPIGISQTDIFFDKKIQVDARKKLVSLFPEAANKKIILYMPEWRYTEELPKAKLVLENMLLNEYLSNDYVILCHYNAPTEKEKLKIEKYFTTFMKDMTGVMSIPELQSVADLVIGDYRPEVFDFAIMKKPILLYAPDYKTYYYREESYFKYEEIMAGPVLANTKEVIDAVLDIENYDYSRLHQFRERFFKYCDGNASKRLAQLIVEHNK